MTREQRIERLIFAIPELSDYRLQLVDKVIGVFQTEKDFVRSTASSLITSQVLEDFGDILRLHHAFSREPFSKDKFEYALERVLLEAKVDAQLAPRGTRGYDIQIDAERFLSKPKLRKPLGRTQSIYPNLWNWVEGNGGTIQLIWSACEINSW